ncbi:MAG: hypothetical protein HYT94_00120 [Parcubacteria group bacterium]|nr:hypothetical protein [Parcubacteria group bacterium]
MRTVPTKKFLTELESFSIHIQKKFEKQSVFLIKNIAHPSLRAKKYDESRDIWQARVDKNVRFYFIIDGDAYVLLEIKNHPK